MKCPKCSSTNIRVADNVNDIASNTKLRQRICRECDYKFFTKEEIVERDSQYRIAWANNHRHHNWYAKKGAL